MKQLRIILGFLFLIICLNHIYGIESLPSENVDCNPDSFYFDSLNIRFIGNWPFGRPEELAYDSLRNLAFFSSGKGVYILDVSDPSNPVKLSESLHTRDFIYWELFYDSNTQRLYVNAARWFEIWDVSNPYSPQKLSRFCLSGSPYTSGDICVSGPYAYCVDDEFFFIMDVSLPSAPQIVGSLDFGGQSVAVKDSFAYVLTMSKFRVINISDPENPFEVTYLLQGGIDIFISGDRAYLSGKFGLKFRIIDISDPLNPQFVGYCFSPDPVYHAHVIDTIAYLATGGGFRIFDISDLMDPQELSCIFCRGRDIFVKDTIAYVVDRENGLRIFNVSDLLNPTEVDTFITPRWSYNIVVSGAFAYIANEKGLWIIDVSDPANPVETGRCRIPSETFDVDVFGSYAYVTNRDSGLVVIDISDPTNPQKIAALELPYYPFQYCLDVYNQYAYIALGWHGFRVVDISDPYVPYVVGKCSLDYAHDVFISGQKAYVISVYDNLTVIDVANPFNPEILGTGWAVMGYPSGIYVSWPYAYAVDSGGFCPLIVFDISTNIPVEIGRLNYRLSLSGLHVSGLYAYYSSIQAHHGVIDISQPTNPTLVGFYQSSLPESDYYGIYSVGTYAYIVSRSGLQIYQFYGSGVEEETQKVFTLQPSLKLLQNPIRGNYINIQILNWHNGNVNLCLYNLLGQKIKTYSFNNLNTNRNNLRLNINDIPSGVYFLRLNGESQTSAKITIIK
jgi:hypothetical protein